MNDYNQDEFKKWLLDIISGRLEGSKATTESLKNLQYYTEVINDLFDLINQVTSFEGYEKLKQSPDFLVELFIIERMETGQNLNYLEERKRLHRIIRESQIKELYFSNYDEFKREYLKIASI